MPSPTAGASEYDRFGPWIDEVTSPDDIPRLYRDHPLDLAGARLVLKVPRNIARRDANPHMDLYDHLLILDDDGLTVLSRRAGVPDRKGRVAEPAGYAVTTVHASQVAAVRDVVSLLDGRLSIHTSAGATVTVRYNGSARANISRLVTALREAAGARELSPAGRALLEAAGGRAIAAAALDTGRDDVALANDARELARHNPQLIVWAGHGRVALEPRRGGAAGLAQRALHALSPATLHGGVLAADQAALEVVGRQDWVVRGRAPVHSLSRLVVPLGGLTRIDLAGHPVYPGVAVARFAAGGSTQEIAVPEGSVAFGLLSDAAARAMATRA